MLKIFHLYVVKSHKKVLLIHKYVTLYFYVDMCFFKNYVIIKFLKSHLWVFSSIKNTTKHWLQWLIHVFENSNFTKFISNYCTCFHNILRTSSSKHMKEMCNINIIFDTKTSKTNHWMQCLIFVNVPIIP
jgi:hypothetical protein